MKSRRLILQLAIIVIVIVCLAQTAHAAPMKLELDVGNPENSKEAASTVRVLLLLTVLSVAPSILIMMTSFTRIIIVLSFLRNALGTQQIPPNQVLIGLALFLTLFIMSPVLGKINDEAYKPLADEKITQQEAIDRSSAIIKNFMLKELYKNGNKEEKDLVLFIKLAKIEKPEKPQDLPLTVVIPAFMIHELTVAFRMGFLIFIPFLVVDMIVSSTLMSMGMMMLPPVMISLPFKIMLFMLAGGWNLTIESLIKSFAGYG